jgi:carboxymethylenebutenolidase
MDIDQRERWGSFGAYLARPESGSEPGVVVIQEIFVVNDHIRSVCDLYAEGGYFALAPDIFWLR